MRVHSIPATFDTNGGDQERSGVTHLIFVAVSGGCSRVKGESRRWVGGRASTMGTEIGDRIHGAARHDSHIAGSSSGIRCRLASSGRRFSLYGSGDPRDLDLDRHVQSRNPRGNLDRRCRYGVGDTGRRGGSVLGGGDGGRLHGRREPERDKRRFVLSLGPGGCRHQSNSLRGGLGHPDGRGIGSKLNRGRQPRSVGRCGLGRIGRGDSPARPGSLRGIGCQAGGHGDRVSSQCHRLSHLVGNRRPGDGHGLGDNGGSGLLVR